MDPKIEHLKDIDGKLTFVLSNVDVSYANGLRRTIIADIPIVCFKTSPYEENKAKISINTSRLNNEIVKQRLSCIPICIKDFVNFDEVNPENPMKNYLLELDVENNTDTTYIVTTKDFKVRELTTNKLLDDSDVRKLFPSFIPPSGGGEYFIDFLRLRPKLSDEIPGERIKLTCEFSVSNAGIESTFNVVSTCAYGYTQDQEMASEQLEIRKQKWKEEGKKEDEITFLASNWKLLEAKRYVKKNSFDFIIEGVGIYDNEDIVVKGCNILLKKLYLLKQDLDNDQLEIKPADTTLENCYDVILENEDYTIGNILNYELFAVFYSELNMLDYVGFKKMHPHDNHSTLRMSLTDKTQSASSIKTMLEKVIENAMKTVSGIKDRIKH